MQLAAEFGTGQVLWSIIWFFLFFIWIMLIFQVFGDIFRSHNSGVSKALWTIGIIFLPYLGVFLYLIVHGSGMAQRQAQSMQKNDEAMQAYIRGRGRHRHHRRRAGQAGRAAQLRQAR